MLKKISFHIVTFLLIFSILTPSFLSLTDLKVETVLLLDNGEEEKNQKEGEKKLEQKEFFMDASLNSFSFITHTLNSHSSFYLLSTFDVAIEILSPPPETMI